MNKLVDVLVIGGGAAGLSAACSACKEGASVLIVEREDKLGGILQQCIHNGFGLHRFREELCGPEYAQRDIDEVVSLGIDYLLNTSALSIKKISDLPSDATAASENSSEAIEHSDLFQVACVSEEEGYLEIRCKSIVLACGCYERSRGQVNIAGTRPAGVYSAGSAQKLINHDGALVGKRVVILGSGDIGLIMARRMTWEGAHVLCVCELMDTPGGLRRNIVQCLEDYNIDLQLSTTVTQILGKDRIEAVELASVDPKTLKPIEKTKHLVECDCLLLSVGLIPENSLAKTIGVTLDAKTAGPVVSQNLETSCSGIFVAGNELHVHDLADYVSEEGVQAGISAAHYAQGIDSQEAVHISLIPAENVGSLTPHVITTQEDSVVVRLRVKKACPHAVIEVLQGSEIIFKTKRQIAIPSEMISIKLMPRHLQDISEDLQVRVRSERD